MDKATAQAIYELATTGRLSPDSTAAVADTLGIEAPGAETEDEDQPAPAKAAAKGSAR